MYLALRTDNPTAELYLLDDSGQAIGKKVWSAGRDLARDLPGEVDALLSGDHQQLAGVIVFRGPGSFTGLRIGITVANAVAYGNELPIVGVEGDDWLSRGLARLKSGQTDKVVLPEYGAPPRITPAKK